MQTTQTKEDISISYISVLCAYAGIAYEIIRHDDDSTDGLLMERVQLDNGFCYNVQLRIQLKCTSSASQYIDNGEYIIYRLKAKNYNDLRTRSTTPVILGLLVLPEDEREWVKWSSEELLMKGCMYWADFSRNRESFNNSTVNVKLKKSNVINSDSLNRILTKIAKEEWP